MRYSPRKPPPPGATACLSDLSWGVNMPHRPLTAWRSIKRSNLTTSIVATSTDNCLRGGRRQERCDAGESAGGHYDRRWPGNHPGSCLYRASRPHARDPGPLARRGEGGAPSAARGGGRVANGGVSRPATHLPAVWPDAPPPRPASHGVSHRLRGALGRASSTLSLCVSGPRDDDVQSPGDPTARTDQPGTALPGNDMGGISFLWPDQHAPPRCPAARRTPPCRHHSQSCAHDGRTAGERPGRGTVVLYRQLSRRVGRVTNAQWPDHGGDRWRVCESARGAGLV